MQWPLGSSPSFYFAAPAIQQMTCPGMQLELCFSSALWPAWVLYPHWPALCHIVLEQSMCSLSTPTPSPIAPLIHTPSAGLVLWLLVMQIPALLIVWPPHPSPVSRAHLSSVPTLNPSCRTLRVTALHAWIPVVLMCVPLTLSMCSLGCVYPSRCVIWLRLGGLFVFLCPREVPMAGDESTLLPGFRACAARQASPLWLVMGWKQPCVSVGSAFICKLAELGGWRRGWEWMKRSDYKSLNQSKFFL